MSRSTTKVSPKSLKENDQDSVKKNNKTTSRPTFPETILAIREKV